MNNKEKIKVFSYAKGYQKEKEFRLSPPIIIKQIILDFVF